MRSGPVSAHSETIVHQVVIGADGPGSEAGCSATRARRDSCLRECVPTFVELPRAARTREPLFERGAGGLVDFPEWNPALARHSNG